MHKFLPFDESRWTRNMRILHSLRSGLERRLGATLMVELGMQGIVRIVDVI